MPLFMYTKIHLPGFVEIVSRQNHQAFERTVHQIRSLDVRKEVKCVSRRLCRGCIAVKWPQEMDAYSEPVCLNSRTAETSSSLSLHRAFSHGCQISDGSIPKGSSLSHTFLQWQHLTELSQEAQQASKGKNKQQTQNKKNYPHVCCHNLHSQ